jgi:uncharacterized membrane protein YjdF
MMPFILIATAGSLISIVLAVVARVETYRYAPLFLIPIIWGILLLSRRLHLLPLHYALVVAAIVLHNFGALGFYQRGFFGVSFDVYVHVYFPFAATFVVHRLLRNELPQLGALALAAGTLLLVLGFGAIHEIVEYASYLTLGEEKGMLKPSTSYFFDTQRDLASNLGGCAAGLVVIALAQLSSRRIGRARA